MGLKLNKIEFIIKSNNIHNNKYDYSLVEYINSKTKVKIVCKEHGVFEQQPNNHLLGYGCSKCGKIKQTSKIKLSIKYFINRSNIIHNNKYDYSLVDYKNNYTKIKIICPIHGEFEQNPKHHLEGKGCSLCSGNKKLNSVIFIENSKKIYGDKYDYSLVDYKNNYTKIKIICKKHGIFEQTPHSHFNSSGCRYCVIDNNRLSINEFIKKSKDIHNNKYDYSLVDYINNHTKIKIICEKHGIFEQTPINHLNGKGCSSCKDSKGEKEIRKILENNNILFEQQKKFEGCKYKKYLKFDFYLPKYNICIEFDGIQHFKSNNYFGGEKLFNQQKIRDKIKNEFCDVNNIKLIRISYKDNIEKKLIKIIN